MKIFFRVIRYANRLSTRLPQFFIFSLLGILFNAISLVTVIPLLNVLFDQVKTSKIPPLPPFQLSPGYFIGVFEHYFVTTIHRYGKPEALLFVCFFIVAAIVISNIFRYLERVTASLIKVDIVKNLRKDFFQNVTRLQIGYFNNQRKGDLMSRFTNDIQEVEVATVNSLKVILKEPFTILVYLGILFFISYKLTLFILLVLPLIGGVLASIVRRLKKQARQSQESLGRVVNILDETFSGMRVIKAFNARKYIVSKMEEENIFYRNVNLSMALKNELAGPVSEVLGVIIVAVIIYVGGLLILNGDEGLDAAQFLGFVAIFSNTIQPAKTFSNGLTSMQKGVPSGKRIFEIIDTQPAIRNKPNAVTLQEFKHQIEFKNVSFAYEKEYVLRGINLIIPKGKTVALVGPSGGGKSTLADLVPRFYDATEGEILIDGNPLVDFEIESLRQHMGIVTQESILFNDTIFNNIAFGMPHASEEAVMSAAMVANAHDFITQTEKGYQTVIGERGSKLSGGQRQRLSIARAVLKNPPILILDEATSALDSESEKLVQEALFNLMKNRTSIVIAHRLSTIQNADDIVVIQAGVIAEKGTHEELIRHEGIYHKLSEIQKMDRNA
jgi:subfamily B ATP-binding cassette protein MsbA